MTANDLIERLQSLPVVFRDQPISLSIDTGKPVYRDVVVTINGGIILSQHEQEAAYDVRD